MSSENNPLNTLEVSPPPTASFTAMSTLSLATFVKLLEPQYLLIVVSASTIIWLGAHGSLRRPPSAAPPKLKKGQKKRKEEQFVEGLVASDVIMFPLMLGGVLIGLYYLIQWLQDPAILNKIIRSYMSLFSFVSLNALAGHALEILESLVFPSMWADGSGQIFHIDQEHQCQFVVNKETNKEVVVEGMDTPLPGVLSRLATSTKSKHLAWEIRRVLNAEYTFRIVVHGKTLVKLNFAVTNFLSAAFAGFVALAYHFTESLVVSNLLSISMCYTTFNMLSPTSFGIGTMILWALFVYDIVMVFYTPYMITVATKIDAPIKLVFKGATGSSMLGLGDIAIPGILMALALRFDLYQHYARKIKHEAIDLTTKSASSSSPDLTATTTTITTKATRSVKTPYIIPNGQWGNRFWTTPFGHLSPDPEAREPIAATAFPKPYFYASLAGYVAGLLTTMVVMLVFRHGQPALLYLVPGVTGSVWLAGLCRGELGDMWKYTEDGSLDVEDVVVEVDGEGRLSRRSRG
ncbi:hypothetical protein N0V88_003811 [Collariella sp. IMI 366227]|nr:hypothetical protein N0V88_003811 [Collariella sp. IMI 366227]